VNAIVSQSEQLAVDMEPYKLRRWRRKASRDQLPLFTCARPGRSKSSTGAVPDQIVDKWVNGLPGPLPAVIVSLLGRKPDGLSEFSFYSFAGVLETAAERGSRPPFADWLNRRHPGHVEKVIEHPTTDFQRIGVSTLAAAAADIDANLSAGRTVVLIDSGGETRTKQVCSHAGFVEDPGR
jgi:hypothetical protein